MSFIPFQASKRLFALVDCNNFYASCERVFNPRLEGKPIVVLSNNDGCVVARSNEAKAMGIPFATPVFKLLKDLEGQGVHIFSSNYSLYGDLSQRVMSLLGGMADEIEVYSIDEAFLSFTGLEAEPRYQLATQMKRQVEKETGIPISIGVGPTKTLAKLANRIAKNRPELKGVFDLSVLNEVDLNRLLAGVEAGDLWGIGHRTAKKLTQIGVKTALDFKNLDPAWVQRNLHIRGVHSQLELQGVACLEMEEAEPRRQEVTSSRSFGQPILLEEHLREALTSFASTAAAKLRKRQLKTSRVMVFINTNPFQPEEPQYRNWAKLGLPGATSNSLEIIQRVMDGLGQIYRPGYKYKQAGVILTDLSDGDEEQLDFLQPSRPEREGLMSALDQVNARYGNKSLHFGHQSPTSPWQMRQQRKSPAYTTDWFELLTVGG